MLEEFSIYAKRFECIFKSRIAPKEFFSSFPCLIMQVHNLLFHMNHRTKPQPTQTQSGTEADTNQEHTAII